MKTKILSIDGKEKGTVDLPKCFSAKIRDDIVSKVLEAKKNKQPYSPSPVAGKQASASGILKHHRHVWKSQYGRGMSRVPRKIMSVRGSQFNWVGATSPNTVGGRRAHPPKIVSMINTSKINKKELKIALCSALSATADIKWIAKRYSTLREKEIKGTPFIVESKLTNLKAKEFVAALKKILGENLEKVAFRKKSVRAGKGKMRGRKYKSNAGLLIVVGENENIKTNVADVVNAKILGVGDLANGGQGRLTIYTENAIKSLNDKLK